MSKEVVVKYSYTHTYTHTNTATHDSLNMIIIFWRKYQKEIENIITAAAATAWEKFFILTSHTNTQTKRKYDRDKKWEVRP